MKKLIITFMFFSLNAKAEDQTLEYLRLQIQSIEYNSYEDCVNENFEKLYTASHEKRLFVMEHIEGFCSEKEYSNDWRIIPVGVVTTPAACAWTALMWFLAPVDVDEIMQSFEEKIPPNYRGQFQYRYGGSEVDTFTINSF